MNTFLFEETRKKLPSYLEERRKMLKLKQCKEIATTRTGYTVTHLRVLSNTQASASIDQPISCSSYEKVLRYMPYRLLNYVLKVFYKE